VHEIQAVCGSFEGKERKKERKKNEIKRRK
jgi:hypothetical protein